MITVYAVQSLAPDVVYFLSQAVGAILWRWQLGGVAWFLLSPVTPWFADATEKAMPLLVKFRATLFQVAASYPIRAASWWCLKPKSSRGFVQCASFRQPQAPARRADGLLSDGRGLGLAERTLSLGCVPDLCEFLR